jgi:hypothetical protein
VDALVSIASNLLEALADDVTIWRPKAFLKPLFAV